MSSNNLLSSPKAFHIPSLDGIRAVSFLIVFFSHDHFDKFIPGLFGVSVFFFLSGYLITTLMRIEIDQTGSLSLRDFYLRRAFRIFPPFYLVAALILLSVKAGWLQGSYSHADLAASMFYITNYWDIFVHFIDVPGFNIFWSLSVEEHFYLAFPFLVLLMLRFKLKRSTQSSVLLVICAAVLIWRCVLVYHLHSLSMSFGSIGEPVRTMFGTDTRLDSILFGCVLALRANPVLDPQPKHSWLLTNLAVLLLLVTFVYRNAEFRETFRYTLQSIALVPLFISAIRLHDHWAIRWLNTPLLRSLGVLSYTLYLVHYPVLTLVQRWSANRLIVAVAALSICVTLAYLIHVGVERPIARFRRRLGSRHTEVLKPSTSNVVLVQ